MSSHSATSKASLLPGTPLEEKARVQALEGQAQPDAEGQAGSRPNSMTEGFCAAELPGKHDLDFTAKSCKENKKTCLFVECLRAWRLFKRALLKKDFFCVT